VNNFTQRAITGAIFVSVMIAGIFYHPLSLLILFGVISILSLWEFYGIVPKTNHTTLKVYSVITGAAVYFLSAMYFQNLVEAKYLVLIFPLIFLIAVIELYRKKERPFGNIAFAIFGVVYISLPFAFLNYLAVYNPLGIQLSYNPWLVMGFFILIWTNDTGAYLAGRAFGKNKLFERISPKKTWEGAVGGLLLTLVTAFLLNKYSSLLNITHWMITAAIIVVFGNLGDLTESLFKRSVSIKDSGNLLPGHGGLLDRFDAVLIAAPMVFTYLYFISH
jgi:phosphatidate cytidylyltransferase